MRATDQVAKEPWVRPRGALPGVLGLLVLLLIVLVLARQLAQVGLVGDLLDKIAAAHGALEHAVRPGNLRGAGVAPQVQRVLAVGRFAGLGRRLAAVRHVKSVRCAKVPRTNPRVVPTGPQFLRGRKDQIGERNLHQ